MSRARDNADLGDSYGSLGGGVTGGSGLDTVSASNITSGTLGNTVQDNITRLGTVTSMTLPIPSATATYHDGHLVQRKFSRDYQVGHANLSSGGWVSHGYEASFKFDFTPKFSNSTILLEYNYGIVHTSTGGGYGFFAFTKDGNRNGWGSGITGYNDSYGHFSGGIATATSMYHSVYGLLVYQNDSTATFEIGLDVKWANGAWYYGHSGSFNTLSVSEYTGNQLVKVSG
tara:strand:+ start:22 stop:708 length:687 start_codon:yes stop_codon:yes gene_type:complete